MIGSPEFSVTVNTTPRKLGSAICTSNSVMSTNKLSTFKAARFLPVRSGHATFYNYCNLSLPKEVLDQYEMQVTLSGCTNRYSHKCSSEAFGGE